jgi:hypothetical protein
MKNKKRPKYIERQLKEVNDFLRANKVQDDYKNPLFWWWTQYLSANGWYRGWNVHVDRFVDGKTIRALAGPYNEMDEYTRQNYYNQIW